MEAVNAWIDCILATVILIGIIEVIVPEGEIRKFVFLVTGVIVSIVIAVPVIKIFSGDISIKEIFSVETVDNNFYYIDTLRNTVDRQSKILQNVFSDNVTKQFNNKYFDMKISECRITFLHDENGKIIEISEVLVRCEKTIDDIELLKRRVAELCEVSVEKVRVN